MRRMVINVQLRFCLICLLKGFSRPSFDQQSFYLLGKTMVVLGQLKEIRVASAHLNNKIELCVCVSVC